MPGVNRSVRLLSSLLLIGGLCGHVFAAMAIGGHYIAWRDHLLGFVLILIVTMPLVYLAGRWFWRDRPDISLLITAAIQCAMGLLVYVNRFHLG